MNMTLRSGFNPADSGAVKAVKTFSEAAVSYIEHGGESKYLDQILNEIGNTPLCDIFSFDVHQLAHRLFPGQSNATKNRCLVTPVRAVCYHGHDRGWGPAARIKNFKQERPQRKQPASQAWLHIFVRQCDEDGLQHLGALVLFLSQTGARVSEAIALEWKDVNLAARTALLVKTKTERNSTRYLPDQLIARLYELRDEKSNSYRVFRYSNRHSVNERIAAVCKRAKITYKPSHTCGRHAFANNTLAFGFDIKSVMDAGGWRSVAVFLGTYANPKDAGRIVAAKHSLYQFENEL